jgi:hypothetical protein
MGRSPQLHPRHILGSAEVVLVVRLGQPGALTGRLARLAAVRFATVFLVSRVARIGLKHLPAKQTVVPLWAGHGSPSLRSMMRPNWPARSVTKPRQVQDEKKLEPQKEARKKKQEKL